MGCFKFLGNLGWPGVDTVSPCDDSRSFHAAKIRVSLALEKGGWIPRVCAVVQQSDSYLQKSKRNNSLILIISLGIIVSDKASGMDRNDSFQ